MLWSKLLIVLLNCMIGIPISMADYGPGKPKLHSDEHTRIYDQIRAGTVVRPDPTSIPRGPTPRTIPFYSIAPGGFATTRDMPDPMEPVVPLPKELFGSIHLGPGKVPEELEWQAPFLDSLTQIVGHEPGTVMAEPSYSQGSWGEFSGINRRITIGGNVLPTKYTDPNELRTTAAHEWGHLLTEEEDPILRAFMKAAPLPKKYRNDPSLGKTDFNQWPDELVASEAFADMFASTLAKHLPEMKPERGQEAIEYPFTPQFRGRSRQRMVDSLVNKLVENLKP